MISKCVALLVVSSLICLAYGIPSETSSSTSDVERTKRQVLMTELVEVLPNPYLNPLVLGRKKRDLTDELLTLAKDPKVAELAGQIDMDQFKSLLSRKKRQIPLVPQIIEVIPNPYLNPLVLGRKKRAIIEDIKIEKTDNSVTEKISRIKRQIPLVPQIVEVVPYPYLNPLVLGRKKRQVELLEQPELVEDLPNPVNPLALERKRRQIPLMPQIVEVLPYPYLNPLVL